MAKCKVTKIKKDYIGAELPPTMHGKAGIGFEEILINDGVDLDQDSAGPDIPAVGCEVKTRNINATSAFGIDAMSVSSIKRTKWEDSNYCKKLQQQLIAFTDDKNYVHNTIVKCQIYDFSYPHIQRLFKEAYNIAKTQILNGCNDNYIPGNTFGYLEKSSPNSYEFRYSKSAFEKLERMVMAAATYTLLFEES